MAITKPIYLTEAQLQAVINSNFPETVKQQARDMYQQIQEEEAQLKTWLQLKKALGMMQTSVITPDKLISILQNNGWKEPTV